MHHMTLLVQLHVLRFAHVAGPVIALELFTVGRREPWQVAILSFLDQSQKVLGQQGDIALKQRNSVILPQDFVFSEFSLFSPYPKYACKSCNNKRLNPYGAIGMLLVKPMINRNATKRGPVTNRKYFT